MNSNSTPRWLVLAIVVIAILATVQRSAAQCSINYQQSGTPPTVVFNLSGTGTAQMNALSMNPYFGSNCALREFSQTPLVPASWASSKTFTCADIATSPQTWYVRAVNLIGPPTPSTPLQFTIIVLDETDPVITCPANIAQNVDPGLCTAVAAYAAMASDNCSAAVTVTGVSNPQATGVTPTGGTFPAGMTTVTLRATDPSGNSASCQFSVSVTDNELPITSCPADLTVNTDPGACTAVVNGIDPASSDNCGVASTAYSLNGGMPVSGTASGLAFAKGVTTVEYTVSDNATNTATCSFSVTVEDIAAPSITGTPASLSIGTSTGGNTPMNLCDGAYSWNHPTVSDNCPGPYLLEMQIGGGGFNVVMPGAAFGPQNFPTGATTMTYRATDAEGNTSTTSFTVTVTDNEAPVVTAPMGFQTSYIVSVTPGSCARTLTVIRPDITAFTLADCGAVTLTQSIAIVNGVPTPSFLNGFPITQNGPNPLTTSFSAGTTVLTYVWTDNVGNTAQTVITVNVQEDQAPIAVCKDITVNLDADGSTAVNANAVDNGSTDNCNTSPISYAISVNGGPFVATADFGCTLLGPNAVTLRVTDAAGNTATCQAVIELVDATAPVVSCPPNITINPNQPNCVANYLTLANQIQLVNDPALVANGTFYDNTFACWNNFPNIHRFYALNGGTFKPVVNFGNENLPVGTHSIVLRVVDVNNSATCAFTLTVKDQIPPVVSNAGPNAATQAPVAGSTITKNANLGGCLGQVTWIEPVFTDACGGTIVVTKTHNPGATFTFGLTTVTYTATDASGNIATYSFNINVVDTQAPMAKCKNATVTLNASGTAILPVTEIDNGSTDNCFFDYGTQQYNFSCSDVGTVTRTMVITDGQGNASSCTAQITVIDNTAPTATCATINTLNLNAAGTLAFDASTLNNGSTDNCSNTGLTYTVSLDGGAYVPTLNLTCAQIGTHVLILRVSDASGNSSTCTRNVMIQDVTAPTFTVPASVQIDACAGTAGTLPANTGMPTQLADACSLPITSTYADLFTNGSCAGAFTITRTWTVTDAAGNSSTKTQQIFVVDNTPPVITVATTVNLQTSSPTVCNAAFTAELTSATVSDCVAPFFQLSTAYTINYPASAAPTYNDVVNFTPGTQVPNMTWPIGTTTVTWRVTDLCGNVATAVVTIVVKDANAPSFAGYPRCGQTYTLNNTTGSCSNLFQWDRPTDPGDIFDCSGFTVTESINNAAIQNFVTLVNPFQNNGQPSTVLAQFPIGATTVTYTATDGSNTSTCSFTVTVVDNQPPTLTCPGNQTLPSTCATAAVPNYLTNATSTDNCPANLTLTQTPAAGTLLSNIPGLTVQAGSVFQVTVKAMDSNPANTQTCTFNVTLQDGQAPIPALSSLSAIVGFCGSDTVFAPLAIDACNANDTIWGTPSASLGMQLPNVYPPAYFLIAGNYVITWSYNDGNGNISTQQQFITLLNDTYPPEAKCLPAVTLELDSMGNVGLTPAGIDNGSNDPNQCGPFTTSINKSAFTCANIGPNVVTLTVTDDAGNTATCQTTVTVKDVIAPALTPVTAAITVQACDTIPVPPTVTASDVCDTQVPVTFTSVSTQDTVGTGIYNYTITRTWLAADDSGNSHSVVQVVTVKDSLPPVFAAAAPDTIVVLTGPDRITCDDVVTIDMIQYLSDCAPDSALDVTNTYNPSQGGIVTGVFALGTYTITFSATDESANTASHSVVLIVRDGTPPVAACINSITVALQPSGSVTITPAQINANSFDNCTDMADLSMQVRRLQPLGAPGASITFACPDADNSTPNPVSLIVTDAAGNTSTCNTVVIVQDNVAPLITQCPPSKTVACDEDLTPQVQGTAIATDNCLANVTVTYDDEPGPSNTPTACSILKRTWTATDLSQNSATCVQTFTIVDNVAPEFSIVPANDTISCSDTLPAAPSITAFDNCTDSVAVTLVVDTIDVATGVCGNYNYTVRRTWTAIDDCGNKKSIEQLVTIQDVTAPQLVGLSDTLTYLTTAGPIGTSCLVAINLNVGANISDCSALDELLISNDSPYGTDSTNLGGQYPVGTYLVHFTFEDVCGNVGHDSIVLEVLDNSIPTAICNDNIVISLGSDGQAVLNPLDVDLGSTDNCGIDTYVLSIDTFDCSNLGINLVALTVTDINGNANTCTVNVNVTQGNTNFGFSLTTTGSAETYFGAGDGAVSATPTGGSGNFAYLWSNGATTPVVAYLEPGTYTVVVTDLQSGCIAVDTAVVAAGAKLRFVAGQASGIQGATVSVPVTVENFIDVLDFTLTLKLENPLIGTALGISNLHPAFAGLQFTAVNAQTVSVTGLPALPAAPVTLPNGAVLFTLDVQLSGTSPAGTSSPVDFISVPTPITVVQDSSGTAVPATGIQVTSGLVTITGTQSNDITLAGDIRTWKNPEVPTSTEKPVPNATVSLTGSVSDTEVTGAAGVYDFSVPSGSNTLTSVSKTTIGNAAITAADLLRIVNHIFGDTLPSPYQWVAADVNNDNKVSLVDYLRIQRVALGTDPQLQGSPDWKFVPKSYVFPPNTTLPNGPLSQPFPQSISHNPATMDFLDDDFVAVRMGDVNGNIMPTLQSDVADNRGSGETFTFRLDEAAAREGDVLEVPFRAADFNGRQAYQLTISFDPHVLALDDVQPGALPELSTENFGLAHLADGHLTHVWVGRQPATVPADETLFTLRFRALRPVSALSTVLRASSDVTRAETYTPDGETMHIDFDFVQPANGGEVASFALFQNQPNPFAGVTTVGFRLPEAGRATLRIFNASGQLVKTVDGDFVKGYNDVRLQRADFGQTGVYWYELESAGRTDRKMMIIME